MKPARAAEVAMGRFSLLSCAVLVAACGAPEPESAAKLSGTIAGDHFAAQTSFARPAGTGGLAIDLADFSAGCGDWSGASSGSHVVTFLFRSAPTAKGEFQVTSAAGGDVSISVTSWLSPSGPTSAVPNAGEIRIDEIGATSIVGYAKVDSTPLNLNLEGTFDASRCRAP